MIHRIHTSDTIATIAARYYGDATRWREIVTANGLRYPFISVDPLDQFGGLLASYTTAGAIAPGQLTIAITGDASLLQPGARVVLAQLHPGGSLQLDATTIASYTAGALTLTSAPANSYVAGSLLRVYPAPGEIVGRVAQPGEQLIIPGVDTTAAATAADPYGCDVQAEDGRIIMSPTGDLALVDGLANMRQAIRNRLLCERGAMVRHGAYGCDAPGYIGQITGPTLVALMQAAVASAISADTRVGEVESVEVEIAGEVVTVSARVYIGEIIDIITIVE